MATIILRDTPVSGAIPAASDIQVGELVSNTTDGRLFSKNILGNIVLLGNGPPLSSSYAVTASYALNGGGGGGAAFPYVGTAAITGSLTVSGSSGNGTVTAIAFNSLSDRAQKDNIYVIQNPLSVLQQINGVRFVWKASRIPSVGVIAQDVAAVAPELTSHTTDGLTVNYNGLIGILIESVKTLTQRVEELERDRV